MNTTTDQKDEGLVLRPEELLYQSLYSPIDLRSLLETSDTRGQIRRLPIPHLFYGLQSLGDEEIQRLLPHLTEQQWTGVLDLALWSRDKMDPSAFLRLQRHVLAAQDAVARKLVRAADEEHWELLFCEELIIHARVEQDEFEGTVEEGESMETPDGGFLIQLPLHQQKAQLIRGLIHRLYQLHPEYAAQLLASCRFRTATEIEEVAYQNRKRRVETMGFQDYFEAIEVYAPLATGASLPEKGSRPLHEVNTLPAPWSGNDQALLLFQALSLGEAHDAQTLLEEVFFVCNKVLSADKASPAQAEQVKRAIRKTISGINLGLDVWSGGSLPRAADGIAQHYLQSFFQLGHGQLLELRDDARGLGESGFRPEPGSFLEAFVEGLAQNYPLLTEQREGRIQTRFLETRQDLAGAQEALTGLRKS